MATAVEALPQSAIPAGRLRDLERAPDEQLRTQGPVNENAVLLPWVNAQAINLTRHAAALRPFRREEFGTGAAAPTPGHLEAVNGLISALRSGLLRLSKGVTNTARRAGSQPETIGLQK